MPYCEKCGTETTTEMAFCPKCGAPIKIEQPSDWRTQLRESRREWRERRRELRSQRRGYEKNEKEEGWEKTEKHEYIFLGPLIGGLVIVFLGVLLYLLVAGRFGIEILVALFFVFVGAIILAGAAYGVIIAGRRHPRS